MGNNLIIFGAGASFGSDKSGTPPLGKDLFDALCSFNLEGWGQISKEFSTIFHEDFEVGMRYLAEKHSHFLPPLQRAMAEFFFNFMPQSTNFYIKLAEKVRNKKWAGSLATLNYERLLESSLISTGIQPIVGKTAESQYEIELCLPHGCCHIFCESVRGTARGISFSGQNVTTNGPVKVITNQQEFSSRIANDAFPPVMSYFDPAKKTTSGVSFIENQRRRFSELVINASIIGIVGLKVRPHDKHIWDPISKSDSKIVYCSGITAGNEFKNWAKKNRLNKKNIILPNYFSDGFDELCRLLGIK